MKFYKNDKKITRKEAELWLGKERLEDRIASAKEAHAEDPYEIQSWMDGFSIEF